MIDPTRAAAPALSSPVMEPEVAPDLDDGADLRPPSPLDRVRRWLGPPRSYRLTRTVLLRLLGVVYLFAFIGLIHQALPLLGSHGLTPMATTLARMRAAGSGFVDVPSLFWIDASDATLVAAAWVGAVLSLLVVAGYANLPIMLVLWLIYGSFVRVGDVWFGFGWEITSRPPPRRPVPRALRLAVADQ